VLPVAASPADLPVVKRPFEEHRRTPGIYLQGNYSYAGSADVPSDGQYSVWQKDNDYVVTWNAAGDDGFHDVVVQGSNPTGDILFA
jgi:hypothetical protein